MVQNYMACLNHTIEKWHNLNALEIIWIQTATLWISYGHPARNKRTGFLFEFHLTITLTVVWIYSTVMDPKNWMCLKSL